MVSFVSNENEVNGEIDGHTSTSQKAAAAGCLPKKMQRHDLWFENSTLTSRHLARKQSGPHYKHLVSVSFCSERVRGMHEAFSGM